MEKTMFDMTNSGISQDQSLALQSEIASYIRTAIGTNVGYCVLELTDLETFEFCHYLSDGSRIDPRPDETREETIDRILFTIDCARLHKIKDNSTVVNGMMSHLFDYVVGALSAMMMQVNLGIEDKTLILRGEKDE